MQGCVSSQCRDGFTRRLRVTFVIFCMHARSVLANSVASLSGDEVRDLLARAAPQKICHLATAANNAVQSNGVGQSQ